MCSVSSGFPFKGDQQSHHWLELRPPPCPDAPPGPDRRFAIGGALLWILHPLCVWTERKMIPLLWIDTSFFPKHAKCSCQPLLVNIYLESSQAWNISCPEKTGWWFWTFGIWNLWWIEIQPCMLSEALACQGKMYFIQPQAWPPRALKGLTYSKVHYWALH